MLSMLYCKLPIGILESLYMACTVHSGTPGALMIATASGKVKSLKYVLIPGGMMAAMFPSTSAFSQGRGYCLFSENSDQGLCLWWAFNIVRVGGVHALLS